MSEAGQRPQARQVASRSEPEASDEALLVRFGNGDPSVAAELTRRLAPRVLSLATRVLGSRAEAEDVTQEAMIRLWKIAPEWRSGEARVTTWLYRVGMNLCIDHKRKARGGHVDLDAIPEPPDPAAGAAEALQEGARRDALQEALMTLPERQRQAVVAQGGRHAVTRARPLSVVQPQLDPLGPKRLQKQICARACMCIACLHLLLKLCL